VLRFHNQQEEFEISGVRFGGQPGRHRTVMIGSMCYPRHSIVEDRASGRCREGSFERLLSAKAAALEETSTPGGIMLFAETAEAMEAHLRRAADLTPLPLFIDSPSAEVRLSGAMRAREMGIAHRVVYNSLSAGATREELEGIRDAGITAAVLMAFNPADVELKGKIYLLEDGGGLLPAGLIDLAREAGIDRPLVDTAVMSAEQGAGASLRAIMVAKAKWGLPSGCALHNAVESYPPLARLSGEDRKLYRYVDVASAAMPIMAGGDFVMYGPLEHARRMCHVAAFADEMMRQAAADL
jgi:tetrahydromethanopterin S-methyltransferase subunit H